MEEKFPKKSYCYKDNCDSVITGFHLERYFSCKICKLEITESLYNNIKNQEKNKKEIDDQIDLWETL